MDPTQSYTVDIGSHVVHAEPRSPAGANRNWLRHPEAVRELAGMIVPEIAREAERRQNFDPVRRQTLLGLGEQYTPKSGGGYAIAHHDTFNQLYQTISKTYYSRFDEALKHSRENARVMEADGLIYSLYQRRFIPTCILTGSVRPQDPDNSEQMEIARRLDRMLGKIRQFHFLKRQLNLGNWNGKSGAQFLWRQVNVDGHPAVIPHRWLPVHGDKILIQWDHTPAIVVRAGSESARAHEADLITAVEYGHAISLRKQYLRDCFAIHQFEPSDRDFLFEGDLAGQVHGVGLRSRVYWPWYFRTEGHSYLIDALQRVSTNGMLVGYFNSGSGESEERVLECLMNLHRDNYAVFPRQNTQGNQDIQHISLGNVAFDVLFKYMEYMDEVMLLAFLGQTLSSQAGATGLGSKVAELHADTKSQIIKYDAISLAETITWELLQVTIRQNRWQYNGRVYHGDDLPFDLTYDYSIDDDDSVQDVIDAARACAELGIAFDQDQVRKKAGLLPPKDPGLTQGGPMGDPNDPRSGPGMMLEGAGTGGPPPEGLSAKDAKTLGFAEPQASGVTTVTMPGYAQPAGVPEASPAPAQYHRTVRYAANPIRHAPEEGVFGIWIPGHVAKALAVQGGSEPEDLHIPLATVFATQWDANRLAAAYRCLDRLSNRWDKLQARLSGLARYDDGRGHEVVAAMVECPGLAEVRSHLCHILDQQGLPAASVPAWVPVIRLATIGEHDKPGAIHLPEQNMILANVTLKVGQKYWNLPFQGSRVARYGRPKAVCN